MASMKPVAAAAKAAIVGGAASAPRAAQRLPPILLRDWINDSLYNKERGTEYYKWLKNWYHEQPDGSSWRTPVELFGPLYSEPLARYILHLYQRFNGRPLKIIEIGPGRGSNCDNIMEYIKTRAPTIYANTRYECVEISSNFAEVLQATVAQRHPGRVKVTNASAIEYNGFSSEDPCIVIGLEVLDNLVHDRVVIRNGEQLETVVARKVVVPNGPPRFSFQERPLEDKLIKKVISTSNCIKPHHKEVYIPTGSYALMEHLSKHLPNACLLFSDFEYFPGNEPNPETPETVKNMPAVHATFDGRTKHYSSMLKAPYNADIYFPTDFGDLTRVYELFNHGAKATTIRNSDFFRHYADALTLKRSAARDGYNPILADYENTSFFLTLSPLLQSDGPTAPSPTSRPDRNRR